MSLCIVGTCDESVAPFPECISHVALTLEVAGPKGSEEPVGTTDIVGIKLQDTGEITPAEHIVDEFRIGTRYPGGSSLFAVAHTLVGHETFGIFLNPTLAGR